jgi:hypothetical protein
VRLKSLALHASVRNLLAHPGPGLRLFLGVYMLVQGVTRIITGSSAAHINVFPARLTGGAMVLAGILLLVTLPAHHRCAWSGRAAGIYAAGIWLLLISAAWPAAAWVSISGGCVFFLALLNEVRIHEC